MDDWMTNEQFWKQIDTYSIFTLLSCIVLMLLWDISLIVLITYQPRQVNKLVFSPYKNAMAWLCLQTLELLAAAIIYYLYEEEVLSWVRGFNHLWDYSFFKIGLLVLQSVKLYSYFGFIFALNFQQASLMLYVLFQSSLRIEYLDVVKTKYHQKEKLLTKNFRDRHIVYIVVFVLLITALTIDLFIVEESKGIHLQMSVPLSIFLICCLILEAMQWVLAAGFKFLHTMHTYQRYEFARHRSKYLAITLTNFLGLNGLFLWNFCLAFSLFCIETEYSIIEQSQQSHMDLPGSLCNDINVLFHTQGYAGFLMMTYLSGVLCCLVPFAVFFALDDPHDCFQCFNKDYPRIYSIFQFARRDEDERVLVRKYSLGYVRKQREIVRKRQQYRLLNTASDISLGRFKSTTDNAHASLIQSESLATRETLKIGAECTRDSYKRQVQFYERLNLIDNLEMLEHQQRVKLRDEMSMPGQSDILLDKSLSDNDDLLYKLAGSHQNSCASNSEQNSASQNSLRFSKVS